MYVKNSNSVPYISFFLDGSFFFRNQLTFCFFILIMSEELHVTDASSAKISSPPDLNRITTITTDVLVRDTSTATSVVINSDSAANGSSVVGKPRNRNRRVEHRNTPSNDNNIIGVVNLDVRAQDSVDGNGTNSTRGVTTRNNLTKGVHATTGKKLHLQQQSNCLPPVAASDTIAAIPSAPPVPNRPTNDNQNGVVKKQTLISVANATVNMQTGTATTAASSGKDLVPSVSGTIPPAPNQPTNHVQIDNLLQQATLAPSIADSIGTMSPVDISGMPVVNRETIYTPPQPKVINLDELVIAPTEKQSVVDDVTDSSLDSYTCTVFGSASCIKPFPVTLLTGTPVISISKDINAYIHLVDMSSTPCCGYKYIFRLVDPVARYGHALPMKANSTNDMESALKRLLLIARKHPNTIYVRQNSLELLPRANNFPSIKILEKAHCPLMVAETKRFSNQLAIWLEDNNNNWLFGVSTVQAVTNALPLSVD
jgi:hypothetical protein